ncbi:hypothetical protein C8T65DRAFT_96181 [Cerioporus squamosus]|nr:hypothetical protein C8T65DRAFT_96181 [Cerioporus squamosus]
MGHGSCQARAPRSVPPPPPAVQSMRSAFVCALESPPCPKIALLLPISHPRVPRHSTLRAFRKTVGPKMNASSVREARIMARRVPTSTSSKEPVLPSRRAQHARTPGATERSRCRRCRDALTTVHKNTVKPPSRGASVAHVNTDRVRLLFDVVQIAGALQLAAARLHFMTLTAHYVNINRQTAHPPRIQVHRARGDHGDIVPVWRLWAPRDADASPCHSSRSKYVTSPPAGCGHPGCATDDQIAIPTFAPPRPRSQHIHLLAAHPHTHFRDSTRPVAPFCWPCVFVLRITISVRAQLTARSSSLPDPACRMRTLGR